MPATMLEIVSGQCFSTALSEESASGMVTEMLLKKRRKRQKNCKEFVSLPTHEQSRRRQTFLML